MAYTMQQVVDRARVPLNDEDKDRYTDATLLGYAVDALVLAATKRPDLLVGAWSTDYSTLTLGSAFPLGNRYFQVIADYVTGRAQLVDEEAAVPERFALFNQMFETKLVTP